jgi:hypothetical protein
MNGPAFVGTIDLWGLVALVALARLVVGLGVIGTVACLVSCRGRPERG